MSRYPRPLRRLPLAALAGTGAVLLAGGPADAATGSVSGTTVTYQAGKGEANDVKVALSSPRGVTISDTGAAIAAGAGCRALSDPHSIVCAIEPGSSLNLIGADGPDTLRNHTTLPAVLAGGSEADVLLGGKANDSLAGGSGDDTLDGGGGPDTFDGGGGRDLADYGSRTAAVSLSLDGFANDGGNSEDDNLLASIEDLRGGAGADGLAGNAAANRLDGGAGKDVASYAHRTTSVSLTLDGVADDGAAGEGDLLLDVENLIGGSAADTLTGDAGDNELDGGLGSDVLQGAGGEDTVTYATRTAAVSLTPGSGNHDDGQAGEGDEIGLDVERLVGGSAPDFITAFTGAHVLVGNGGGDHLQVGVASSGSVFDGGDGDDLMLGSNAADVMNGGGGDDDMVAIGGADELDGGDGEDALIGGDGDDVLRGGDDDDTIDDGGQASGADDSRGGQGRDLYRAPHHEGVTIRLNDLADDGAAGEGDNVHTDIESVLTGSGDDTLVGSPGAETLDAGFGSDTIDGRAGRDELFGRGDDDDITSLDGEFDTISCGGSPLDSLVSDAIDAVPSDDCPLRTNGG